MARYKLSFECEFDENSPIFLHTEAARTIVKSCCPSDFGMSDNCELLDCKECWFRALEGGVSRGEKFIHVRRLD